MESHGDIVFSVAETIKSLNSGVIYISFKFQI